MIYVNKNTNALHAVNTTIDITTLQVATQKMVVWEPPPCVDKLVLGRFDQILILTQIAN